MGKTMRKNRCVLIGAQTNEIPKVFAERIQPEDFLLCVDGGVRFAIESFLSPDLVIGDFDSGEPPCDPAVEVIRLPKQKDDTDLHFAAQEGLRRGFTDFLLTGVTGGRLDHTIASLCTLRYLVEQKAKAELCGHGITAFMTDSSITLSRPQTPSYFSVFPFDGVAEGVTLVGAKYPLTDAVLRNDFPLGVSNEFAGESVTVSVGKGCLLVLVVQK